LPNADKLDSPTFVRMPVRDASHAGRVRTVIRGRFNRLTNQISTIPSIGGRKGLVSVSSWL
jgi:hypothetical protein